MNEVFSCLINKVIRHNLARPFSKKRPLIINLESHADNYLLVKVVGVIGLSVSRSYPEIPDNCLLGQFIVRDSLIGLVETWILLSFQFCCRLRKRNMAPLYSVIILIHISSFQPAFPLPAGRKGWGLGKETTPPTPSPKKAASLCTRLESGRHQERGDEYFSNTFLTLLQKMCFRGLFCRNGWGSRLYRPETWKRLINRRFQASPLTRNDLILPYDTR